MSREVTQLELLLVCALCLLGVMLVSGCVTKRSARTYHVKEFTLVVMDQQEIRDKYKKEYGKDHPCIQGYCDMKARVMYVSYADKMPNMSTLGHEVWHLPEMGGRWHK